MIEIVFIVILSLALAAHVRLRALRAVRWAADEAEAGWVAELYPVVAIAHDPAPRDPLADLRLGMLLAASVTDPKKILLITGI